MRRALSGGEREDGSKGPRCFPSIVHTGGTHAVSPDRVWIPPDPARNRRRKSRGLVLVTEYLSDVNIQFSTTMALFHTWMIDSLTLRMCEREKGERER